MRKLFTYLFKKPKIKIGDKLNYGQIWNKNYHVEKIRFDWKDCIWFLKLKEEDLSISAGIEEFYKNK